MIKVKSEHLFDKSELPVIASAIASHGKNIIIFGLYNSGKSTLVREICRIDRRFKTLDEEEIISSEDTEKIMKKTKKLWAISHQYPTQNQNVSFDYLIKFSITGNLSPKNWLIVKILK